MMARFVRRHMRGSTQEQLIRRRDAAPKEMEILAKVMSDPEPDPKEVHEYIQELMQKQHIPPQNAYRVMASMPSDPQGLRVWARQAFSLVMHQAIHGHAAFPRELFPRQEAQASGESPQRGLASGSREQASGESPQRGLASGSREQASGAQEQEAPEEAA